ncbi:MAG TPA: methylmalonyl-CoA mutase family protein, partial [Gemmatimonadales bacterium]|nr:methylmalonyl-CoA mutase family protein [Gemmatimonadales bacterium]
VEDDPVPALVAPDYGALAATQRDRLVELRARRDPRRWAAAREALLGAAASPSAPLMDHIVEAVRARATVGEISDVLRSVWGTFRPRREAMLAGAKPA